MDIRRKQRLYVIGNQVEKILAGRQGFEPRSDGPEPPVLPLDDLPALGIILEKRMARFKAKATTWDHRSYWDAPRTIFAQGSLSVTVRLKTGFLGCESGSAQKYPSRSNWYLSPGFALATVGSARQE
jgi:hypothetical protein